MTQVEQGASSRQAETASYILAAAALLLVVKFHLLPALLAGLLVHEVIRPLTRGMSMGGLRASRAKVAAVTLMGFLVVALLSLAILGFVSFLRNGNESLPALLTKMADILEDSRKTLPVWALPYLPEDTDSLKQAIIDWLKENAAGLKAFGKNALKVFLHILAGMIIGAIFVLQEVKATGPLRPFAQAVSQRAGHLCSAFRNIVFAQIRIAAVNALLTGLYLAAVLPLLGIHLPLTKTLIAVTFLCGVLPVIGNLISNTVIVIVSMSHSLPVAVGSMAFLVIIHKLEYFLNAHIIGSRIKARVWELLVAMLVMESIFGVAGLIAAPVYYAYAKSELTDCGLI